MAIARFEMLVTAESELVPGWKYTLIKLTPGKDRDSMCSILLASVKNRSKRPVISASICSGGMPEKNVATITTGMLISGKRSTGIRATAVIPTTAIIRHTTRIRYGLRIEKPGISSWSFASHEAKGGDADLFIVSDRSAFERLDLLREELQ